MGKPSHEEIIQALISRHGRTFAEELNIPVSRNTPSPLFRLLCAAILYSTRISAEAAASAARALAREGWTTPKKMADATWAKRAKVLNKAGYARYDEKTSTMLGEAAERVIDRYRGDLRRLRQEAGEDPRREHELLKEFKGIGDTGADIFCREVQVAWSELSPYVDRKALVGAKTLGLPQDPRRLARLAGRDLPRLTAALIRVQLARDAEDMLRNAGAQ